MSQAKLPTRFSRRLLERNYAITLGFAKASTLSNPIHPIFQLASFEDTSSAVYAILAPALRLASRFVTEQPCLDWWSNLIFAEKIWRPELAHDALNGSHNPSAKALLATRAALNSLASRVKFQWFDIPERIFGMTDEGSDGKSARVVLQKGYHDFFQNEFLNASLEQQHRASLAFAVTLTHELAHAVYLILRCGSINVPEPYFSPADPVNELGSACISSLFNVEIQPINMLFSAKDGLSCHRWADRYRPGPLTHHAVPIGWVCSLFDERTWQRIRREGKGELAVPIGNLSSMAPLTEDFQGLS